MSKLDKAPTAFTFDDFTFAPVHSGVLSRKNPEFAPDVTTKLQSWLSLDIPIIASPMNTVTESAMVRTIDSLGGASVLHRYMSIEDQVGTVKFLTAGMHDAKFFVAVGATGDLEERLDQLSEAGATMFCVDVANGHNVHCIKAVELIRNKYPASIIMAGNVCTFDGAYRLLYAGTDVLRVGIGGGSVCTTRVVTGHGVPQLTAIEECVRATKQFDDVSVVADGGIRNSGDMVKALAIGADAVMLGSLLAGTSDTPGHIKSDSDGEQYKDYNGMASEAGRSSWFGQEEAVLIPEGVSTRVPYKGETSDIVNRLIGGLRSGMSYAGAHDLEELRENAVWVKVSAAGYREGTPHGK